MTNSGKSEERNSEYGTERGDELARPRDWNRVTVANCTQRHLHNDNTTTTTNSSRLVVVVLLLLFVGHQPIHHHLPMDASWQNLLARPHLCAELRLGSVRTKADLMSV